MRRGIFTCAVWMRMQFQLSCLSSLNCVTCHYICNIFCLYWNSALPQTVQFTQFLLARVRVYTGNFITLISIIIDVHQCVLFSFVLFPTIAFKFRISNWSRWKSTLWTACSWIISSFASVFEVGIVGQFVELLKFSAECGSFYSFNCR